MTTRLVPTSCSSILKFRKGLEPKLLCGRKLTEMNGALLCPVCDAPIEGDGG